MWSTVAKIAYFEKLYISLKFAYIQIFRTKSFMPYQRDTSRPDLAWVRTDQIGSCPCCLRPVLHSTRFLFTSGRTSPLVKNRGGGLKTVESWQLIPIAVWITKGWPQSILVSGLLRAAKKLWILLTFRASILYIFLREIFCCQFLLLRLHIFFHFHFQRAWAPLFHLNCLRTHWDAFKWAKNSN